MSWLERVDSADSFHLVALPGLAEVVPADLWGFNEIDTENRAVRALTWPDIVPEPHYRGIDAVVWEHPVLQHFQRSGDGGPRRLSDFWTRDQLHRSRLYQVAYGPVGVEYQVGFTLADGPTASTTFFAANRRDSDFTDGELALLAQIRAPLRATWQRVQAQDALGVIVGRGEASRHQGAVLVDHQRMVRTLTGTASCLLHAAGLAVEPGAPLPGPLFSWARGAGPATQPTVVGRGDDAAVVSVVAGGVDADLVFSVDHALPYHSRWRLMPREVSVLELVAAGRTTRAVAQVLAISHRTVEKHLERIYEKLGVTNRTEAAAAVAKIR